MLVALSAEQAHRMAARGGTRVLIAATMVTLAVTAWTPRLADPPSMQIVPGRDGPEHLDAIPGIGPATARAIGSAAAEGLLRSAADLERVRGIGPAKARRIAPHISIEVSADRPLRTPGP